MPPHLSIAIQARSGTPHLVGKPAVGSSDRSERIPDFDIVLETVSHSHLTRVSLRTPMQHIRPRSYWGRSVICLDMPKRVLAHHWSELLCLSPNRKKTFQKPRMSVPGDVYLGHKELIKRVKLTKMPCAVRRRSLVR